MDVEFDSIIEENGLATGSSQSGGPSSALANFDTSWYIQASRRARRMDLIGDYAGREMFVIDGDSLLRQVLDDPLLALGRINDSSFQILHAFHSLERVLNEFRKRNAVFEIVFWEDAKDAVFYKDTNDFAFASRSLARAMLVQHLHRLNIPVHHFQALSDPKWQRFRMVLKPMFIMLDDGGPFDHEDEEENMTNPIAQSILVQRVRIFNFITQGLSCSLLRGTTFRDSKITTFIYEQRLEPDAKSRFKRPFWKVVDTAHQSLRQLDTNRRTALLPRLQHISKEHEPLGSFLEIARLHFGEKDGLASWMLRVFVAHLLLLPSLSVQERCRSYDILPDNLDEYLGKIFLPTIFLIYEAAHQYASTVDVDGRVFRALLRYILSNPSVPLDGVVGEDITSELEQLWEKYHFHPAQFSELASQYSESSILPDAPSGTVATKDLQLLPFSNPVFTEILADTQIATAEAVDDISTVEMDFNTVFRDTQHWHNHRRALLPKHLGGEDKAPAQNEWQRKRQLRSEQRFTAKLQWQAESLTGAWGKTLQQIAIVTGSSAKSASSAALLEAAVNQKPKKKKAHVSKAEQIRLENTARKLGNQDHSNEAWWKEQLVQMDLLSTEGKTSQVDRLLGNPARSETGWLAVEMRLYRLQLELRAWVENSDSESDEDEIQNAIRDKHTVTIMRMIKELSERGGLFPTARKCIETILCCLGFTDYITSFLDSSPPSPDDRKLGFTFMKIVRTKTKAPIYKFMPIVEDPVVWQLRLFGEYMDRSMDSQPDPRVSFNPDAWQRLVLDCLDDVDDKRNLNHSVLVVAPTSAGKTFISYYAMEQVLRRSDDEILVYVAPTKALVSQIAAEVYARFKKSYKSVGTSLWAIHTRDYRVHNPQNCQILVTVPEMLAIMLLSPQLSRHWAPRIKRIVLDEIHSIGQQEGGAVWEQIILLAPCPIVGLSATIGEAEKFNAWLASVQEAHGFRHSFIHHPHRYSHLRKYNYTLHDSSRRIFSGTDSHVPTGRMRFLHPVSLLSFGTRLLPSDFSLESADCLKLYHAFKAIARNDQSELRSLEPAIFFKREAFLKQKDILDYECVLKDKLVSVIASSDPQDGSSALSQLVAQVQDPTIAKLSLARQNTASSTDTIMQNLIFLLCDLHAQGDLPAILFNFDRSACELAALTLLSTLKKREAKWRATSAEWQRKMEQWEKWKSQAAAREKQAERLRKQKRDAADGPAEQSDPSWESSFSPADPSPQFSFLGKKSSKEVLNEAIADIRWTPTPKWALDALLRGIGVHHAGMNKHYRTTVESLYRMGYIQVVIATGTLALGINAPTKTSVFLGDSPFLTALMYRQCAGRAGRRGFDLLGKVVFYALPMERVQRLVLSKLPSIGGNFPLTSTMVLRLFNLLQGSAYAPVAVNAIKGLLRLPQISFVSETGKAEMLHHIRFSIDYLRRSGLLDAEGNPINLFGLAAHLYHTEPSNFALVVLMRQGVIHDICNQTSTQNAKHDLVVLLCHIFGRRYLPSVYASARSRELFRKSPSKIILPPMPVSARNALLQHNTEILHIFTRYATAYASKILDVDGGETHLPLSKLDYSGEAQSSPTVFHQYLKHTRIRTTSRSPFVANSGHDDRFGSVSELSQTCRSGLHLNEHSIPSMHEFTNNVDPEHADTLLLNAYLLDFYTHGQTAALVAANGIRLGDLWYLLEDFTLTLKTIRATVEHLLLRTTGGAGGSSVEGGDDEIAVAGVNGAEVEFDDEHTDGDSVARPLGVSDRDWKVFEVVDMVTKEFDEKFRAMWA